MPFFKDTRKKGYLMHKTKTALFATDDKPNKLRAWTCHGRSQEEMVDKLTSAGIIKSKEVRDCLLQVDRSNYVSIDDNDDDKKGPYGDRPYPIGCGQTISAPHMHAQVLEEMLPFLTLAARRDHNVTLKILDVGCGSGFLTAVLGRLLLSINSNRAAGGIVYGMDVLPQLVHLSRKNMEKEDSDLLMKGIVQLQQGNGWNGAAQFDELDNGKFHAIHVGAAAETFPQSLMMQLTLGGVMICPIGPVHEIQTLYRIEKIRKGSQNNFSMENYDIQSLLSVRYVPLIRN